MDASFEEGKYSGVGGALYNSQGRLMKFFSEELRPSFLERVKREGQINIIQELDMLALLVSIEIWGPEWNGHRIVLFTDSESVRTSFLKTWPKNDPCSRLLTRIFALEEGHLCPLWIERVPSQSNPADHLSRDRVAMWIRGTEVDPEKVWDGTVLSQGKSAKCQRLYPTVKKRC